MDKRRNVLLTLLELLGCGCVGLLVGVLALLVFRLTDEKLVPTYTPPGYMTTYEKLKDGMKYDLGFVVNENTTSIRNNGYWYKTTRHYSDYDRRGIFDFGLYLADHGATDFSLNISQSNNPLLVEYSFSLDGYRWYLYSKYGVNVSQTGENTDFGLLDSWLVVQSKHDEKTLTCVRDNSSNYKNEYMVMDRFEPIIVNRSTLGQMCYLIQTGDFHVDMWSPDASKERLEAYGIQISYSSPSYQNPAN